MRKIALILLALAPCSFGQVVIQPTRPNLPNVLTVGDGGRYSSITAAVSAASLGDTILIAPGTYDLGTSRLVLPPYVSLVGTGHWRDTIITSASTTGTTVLSNGGRCRIENLWIKNTSASGGASGAVAVAVAENWQPNTVYAKGDVVSSGVGSGELGFVALNAGTSGGVAPTWPPNEGDTVTDNGITWRCYGSENQEEFVIRNCGLTSTAGYGLWAYCGERMVIDHCTFKGWGRWACRLEAGAYEETATPYPRHGVFMDGCFGENQMSVAQAVAAMPVGFVQVGDRHLFMSNCQVSMSCDANLAAGGAAGGIVAGVIRATTGVYRIHVVGSTFYFTGANNNNKCVGVYNTAAIGGGANKWIDLRNNRVDGLTSHASGILYFEDAKTNFFGGNISWRIDGGNVNRRNWTRAYPAEQMIVDLGGLAMGCVKANLPDLPAGADLGATAVMKLPLACTLQDILVYLNGSAVGVDADNPVIFTVKDGGGNTVATKTYNAATRLRNNDWNQIAGGKAVAVAADETITIEITQGTTANLPPLTVMLQYDQ